MADDIEEAVNQILRSSQTITEICAQRGYPDALPQGATLPAYTYEEISSDSEHDLQAASGFAHTRIQISCYGNKRHDANRLRSAIRTVLLQRARGVRASTQQYLTDITVGGRYGRYEAPLTGVHLGRYVRLIDFIISHTETAP